MRDDGDERTGGLAVLARAVPVTGAASAEVLRLRADADLAAVLPHPCLDLRGNVGLVGVVAGVHPAGGSLLDPSVTGKVGTALGVWHSASRRHRHRFGVATPIGLFLDRDRPAVAADPLLRVVLDALRQEWWPTAVVHGDLGHDALWVVPDDRDGVRVVFDGWDRAGLGDPGWDLGCLLADLLATAVGSGEGRDAGPAMAAALASYGLTAAMPWDTTAFARRVALSAIARLAAGVDVGAGAGTGTDDGSLELARSVAAWLPTWTRRFERWLGEPHERARSRALHPAGGAR